METFTTYIAKTNTEEPTLRFRFVAHRDNVDGKVLQQAWIVKIYDNGRISEVIYKWRSVPLFVIDDWQQASDDVSWV